MHHSAIFALELKKTQSLISGSTNPTSSHFGVQSDGQIDQYLKLNTSGYHVLGGTGAHQGDNARIMIDEKTLTSSDVNLNRFSTGIEIYYCPRQCAGGVIQKPSDEQISSIAKLLFTLEKTREITPDRLFFHSEIQPTDYGDRWQEPQYLVFDKTSSKGEIKIHSNWYKLIAQIRAFGGYKSDKWSKMSDKEVADFILRNNFQTAINILQQVNEPKELDKERLQGYKNALLALNKDL